MRIRSPLCGIARLASDSLYRNSIFMAATSLFNAGCGFFFWMIAARLYTVEQVGLATALISSLGLIILFSRLGFDTSIIRFYPSEERGSVIGTSLAVSTAACLLAGLGYALAAELLSPQMLFLREPGYALAFLLICAANSAASVTASAFLADRRAEGYLMQNLFMALRIPALLPLAVFGVFGIFWSVGIGYAVASLFSLMMLKREGLRLRVDGGFIRSTFRFSAWSYLSSILLTAPTLILPIMVLNMLGEAEAVKYYIAMAIGNPVLIIPSSLGTSLFLEASHGQGPRAWLNKTPTTEFTENSPRRMAGPHANAATTKAQRHKGAQRKEQVLISDCSKRYQWLIYE